jgi:MbtH protein
MSDTPQEEDVLFHIVHNDEEQYSVWWADRQVPAGWYVVGDAAPRQACLDRINELWTDMRPASLRRRMAEQASAGAAGEPSP